MAILLLLLLILVVIPLLLLFLVFNLLFVLVLLLLLYNGLSRACAKTGGLERYPEASITDCLAPFSPGVLLSGAGTAAGGQREDDNLPFTNTAASSSVAPPVLTHVNNLTFMEDRCFFWIGNTSDY